jgi:DNA polymerase III subunit beta
VDTDKYSIEINSESGKFKIMATTRKSFLKCSPLKIPTKLEIDADMLVSAINKTIFAVANDDLRPVMSGVYCNFSETGMIFVATDAHRLVKFKKPIGRYKRRKFYHHCQEAIQPAEEYPHYQRWQSESGV